MRLTLVGCTFSSTWEKKTSLCQALECLIRCSNAWQSEAQVGENVQPTTVFVVLCYIQSLSVHQDILGPQLKAPEFWSRERFSSSALNFNFSCPHHQRKLV